MLSAYQLDRSQRNLAGYAVLGVRPPLGLRGISVDDAAQQAISGESSKDFGNSAWMNDLYADIQNGQIASTSVCQGAAAPNVNLFQSVSGLALGTTSQATGIMSAAGVIGAGTGLALGAVTMGAGLAISVIGMIFAHHAAAVRQEQSLYCGALSAANNALNLIAQAVAAGQTTPAAASAALDALLSQAESYVSPSLKHNPCNANCELMVVLRAIVLYQKSQYADMAAAQPGSGSAGSGPVNAQIVSSGSILTIPQSTAAPTSAMPSWMWLAAAGLVAIAVTRGL